MIEKISQRDPRWANETLGTQGTIGNYGCTITCISMLLGKTPSEINQSIKNVGGYAQGNLVDWSKLPLAFSQIKSALRVRTYDNEQVKQAIEKYGGCLVEVDGARIGATKHWCLYIGGGQMYDPWFGTQKTTSYYPPTGLAVLEIDKIVSTEPMITIPAKERDDLIKRSSILTDLENAGYPNIQAVNVSITGIKENYGELKKEYDNFILKIVEKLNPTGSLGPITDKNTALSLLDEVIIENDKVQSELKEKEDQWKKASAKLTEENKILEKQVGSLRKELEELRDQHTAQIEDLNKQHEVELDRLEKRIEQVSIEVEKNKEKRAENEKTRNFIIDLLSRFFKK